MFSPLALGSANWDGGVQIEQKEDDFVSRTSHEITLFSQHAIQLHIHVVLKLSQEFAINAL